MAAEATTTKDTAVANAAQGVPSATSPETTIESRVAAAILEREVGEIEINGRVYKIAPPTLATLILASEVVSQLPVVERNVPADKIVYSVLKTARGFRALGDLAAVLILGAKGLTEERTETVTKRYGPFGLLKRTRTITRTVDKRGELAEAILNNVRPSTLFDILVARLNRMEVGSFFALTTSLSEANVLTPTKTEVEK